MTAQQIFAGEVVRRPSGLLLAMIAASGTLAMHIFVPALPQLARDLAVTPGTAQLTLTLYLIGIAAGQLVYGPVSDRFGRRPVLIVSLSVFLVSTLVAGFAPSIEWLLAARVAQALGACGGLVLGRAMVRDSAAPGEAARQMALLVMAMTATPALAPLIGGLLGEWFGWRSIFGFLGAVGGILLLCTLTRLPETNRRRLRTGPRDLLRVYASLLRRRDFRLVAIGGACLSTSLYAFFSAAPFLFVDVLHRPMSEVGFYYMSMVGGITLGSFAVSRLSARLSADAILRLAAGLALLGASALLAVDLAGLLSVPAILVSMGIFAFGSGFASPVATARAIGVDPQAIGAASGLYGFLQMAFGALCTALAGLWHTQSALPTALILLFASVTACIALALGRERAIEKR